jgi:hypothetical protein
VDLDLMADGWVGLVDPVPGWEPFHIYLRADLVDGAPVVTGLRIEPRADAKPAQVALTQNRLRTFPAPRFAAAAYHATHLRPATVGDLIDAMERTKPKGRGATSPEQVAAIYTRAREAGKAPRAAVCNTLNISTRTADRYISQARKAELLAPYRF